MINTQNKINNMSFTGKFYVEGSKKAVDNLYKLVVKENAELKIPTDCCDFSSRAKLILTDSDIIKYSNPEMDEESGINLANFYINADELMDSTKTALKKTVSLLCPFSGLYRKITPKRINGMTFFPFETNNLSSGFEAGCKFPKKLSLADALTNIDKLRKNKEVHIDRDYFVVHAIPDISKAIDVISKSPVLSKLKTNRLIDSGVSSMIFDIGNEKCLKLSHKPVFPHKLESFDLPIDKKGYSSENGIYWCIYDRVQNHMDVRIKQADIMKILDDIKAKGYTLLTDININSPHQFGVKNGKLYLIDYECVLDSNRKSRMRFAESAL